MYFEDAYTYRKYGDNLNKIEPAKEAYYKKELSSLKERNLSLYRNNSELKVQLNEEILKNQKLTNLNESNEKYIKECKKSTENMNYIKNKLKEYCLAAGESCPICYEEFKADAFEYLACAHLLCSECILKIQKCPICRADLE